ncbi:zinc finger MYND domain-containing protein 12 isoform X2 [Gopherus flavomarginatus]|uniref:zinc finger MYND domain-containing protein 12 isoform X2 n=1 Tax=Gopherus flavomarginatus TaxID=286002 RepID=UPI0021CC0E7C|nr:zinc finger MYND domain-containing protein 12 isoform X2 [Gopherus flavomarginatus]
MNVQELVPLALPRGRPLSCELCGGPAQLRCGACHVAYYCDVDHQKADWVSIHEKICQLLIPIRTSFPFFNSEKERKHGMEQLLHRQKHLVDFTHKVAQKFVFEGRHEVAIPAALHSLRFSIDTCGPDSVELVPAYLILAEASTGLGRLTQAEEYLSQAQWIVLKTSDCSNGIQSKLHRNLGLLYAAKGNFEESVYHLATDVTDIWHAHFSRLIQVQSQTLTSPAEINILSEEEEISEESLNEAQQTEASQVLNAILDIREQAPKQQPAKTANVVHALSMLHYLIFDFPKAHELGMKAFLITKQLPNQDACEAIHHLLKYIKSKLFYTK